MRSCSYGKQAAELILKPTVTAAVTRGQRIKGIKQVVVASNTGQGLRPVRFLDSVRHSVRDSSGGISRAGRR